MASFGKEILGIHALSGCDTVSYLNGKGKVSVLKVLNQTDITGLNPPSLKSLPPTDTNLACHIARAHLQMMLWKTPDQG